MAFKLFVTYWNTIIKLKTMSKTFSLRYWLLVENGRFRGNILILKETCLWESDVITINPEISASKHKLGRVH